MSLSRAVLCFFAIHAEIFAACAYPLRDFLYYNDSTRASIEEDGLVSVESWTGSFVGSIDVSLGEPYMTRLTIPAGSQYPSGGMYDPWHMSDLNFILVSGNVSFTCENDTAFLTANDIAWIRAGTAYSPLEAVEDSVVLVFSAAYDPITFRVAPTRPTEAPTDELYHRFYLTSKREWLEEDVDHYEWYSTSGSDPDILSVKWAPNGSLAAHYHGEGAVYIVSAGMLCFNFTDVDAESCIGAGEARWVRPGYRYAGEYATSLGAMISVLNVHSGPNMNDIPDDIFFATKSLVLSSVGGDV